MNFRDNFKYALTGSTFAVISALGSTVVYIVAKIFLLQVDILDFFLVWFFAGFCYVGLAFVLLGKWRSLIPTKSSIWFILLFGFGNLLSVYFFFRALKKLTPVNTAWLSQLDFALAALLALVVLGERMNKTEIWGFLLTFSGAGALIAIDRSLHSTALLLVLASALIEALLAVFSKYVHTKGKIGLDMRTLPFHRTWFIVLGVLVARFFAEKPIVLVGLETETILKIALGALFGPAIGAGFYYLSLAYTDVYRAATIKAAQPLFVLIGSWFLWHTIPSARGIISGLCISAGIALMLYGIAHKKSK